jgi:hypothetical protein
VAGAYDDFERRMAAAAEPTGSKQERVREYILTQAPLVMARSACLGRTRDRRR